MKYIIFDKKYNFKTAFDTETGAYVRTGILDENGNDTGKDPFMASFPHLIDVGIMGHCKHGKTGLCSKAGIGCYQRGAEVEHPNMSLEDFKWIAEQCNGRCNQLALGGRGDPDQHEKFEEILKIARENNLVPNFTTSGYRLNSELARICKKYCGAVAVSWYRNDYTIKAIRLLIENGVKTNIHFVLGNNSIDEAIKRLEEDDFPDGINAVIFLLHKPVGQGSISNMITIINLIYRLLYQKSKIKRNETEGKDFLARFMPSNGKGDVIDGTLVFTTEEGQFSLHKEWGEACLCELIDSNGDHIRKEETIREILDDKLVYKQGLYKDVVFVSQKNQADMRYLKLMKLWK